MGKNLLKWAKKQVSRTQIVQNVHKYQQISDNGEEGTPLVRVNPIPGLACRIYPLLSVELGTIGQWELFQSAINNIASCPASARAGLRWD